MIVDWNKRRMRAGHRSSYFKDGLFRVRQARTGLLLLLGWVVFSVTIVAQGGGGSSLKPPKDANGIIVNFPSGKKNSPELTEPIIYIDGESEKVVKARVLEGVPEIRQVGPGSNVSKQDSSGSVSLALFRSDGKTKVRVKVPAKYASGVVFIKVGNAFLTHLLVSEVFAIDVEALLYLGQQGIRQIDLRVYPAGPFIQPRESGIGIVLESDQWNGSLTF
ncbi:MAG: hypothetical protein ACE5F1_19120 [Planctomycetota bacterium]